MGREILDAGASPAFALADHQLAHVYVQHGARVAEVKALLEGLDGVELVLDEEGKRAHGLDHPRSGELVAIATADRWFSYYYWLDDARAPDFARTVDIHRKPGYDPVELFVDPAIRLPPAAIGWRLAKRKLGMRTLLDVISLKDTQLVKGSHGRLTDDPDHGPAGHHAASRTCCPDGADSGHRLQAPRARPRVRSGLSPDFPVEGWRPDQEMPVVGNGSYSTQDGTERDRLLNLESSLPDHPERDIENDRKADIGDPAVALQQARDERCREAHERNGEHQPEDQNDRMLAGGAGHRENVVERHRDVGDDDLPGGLGEGLARRALCDPARSVGVRVGESLLGRVRFGRRGAQLAPHLPAHPQEQDAARDEQADDRKQPRRDAGEQDAQHRRGDDADEDRPVALLGAAAPMLRGR